MPVGASLQVREQTCQTCSAERRSAAQIRNLDNQLGLSVFFQRRNETIKKAGGKIKREVGWWGGAALVLRSRLLLLPQLRGGYEPRAPLSPLLFQPLLKVRERGRHAARVPDGGSAMTGSAPQLGVLLLLAVLLQTAVVTITVLHFTTALSSVRLQSGLGTARRVDASRTGSVRMSDRLLSFCFCLLGEGGGVGLSTTF